MGSISTPHAVCVPYPAQGHVNPMLKLAKLLHHRGFFITFVNTEYNHSRLLDSHGPSAVAGLPDFRFETISDGFPPSDACYCSTENIPSLCVSITTTCLEPFCDLITNLNSSGDEVPPVTCIVSDGIMSFTVKAAERFGLPKALLWTCSACGVLAYTQYTKLVEKGYTPLQDMSQVTNGYLETPIDWISGMKNIRLRDIPTFIRTTDAGDKMFNFLTQEIAAVPRARALILNTFDALERDSLDALEAMFPRVYAIGPLQLMMDHVNDERLQPFTSNLRKEEVECIEWLDSMPPDSVIYVNFSSITMMTADQMTEFAWGLANSRKPFLWIIRPDMVGETVKVPPEFVAETKDRSMLVSWCPQEHVLNHPAIGGFLTHAGWNSTLETIVGGVPVICWPFFAEQQTNCRYMCTEWGMGMEMDSNVKREELTLMVKELMDGDKGREMKKKVKEWKRKAEEAAANPNGSSYLNLDKFIKEGLLQYI